MARVTQHYQISKPVPFVDVRVEQDNRLFLEPSAIRAAAAAGDPYAISADRNLTSFFDHVLDSARCNDLGRRSDLLQHLHEPNETRLGMTRVGVAGHGLGNELTAELWSSIRDNPACQEAVLVRRLEDLAPYVAGVGPDLISDLSTRITFGILAEFTASMIAVYPQLGIDVSRQREYTWDSAQGMWVSIDITLPVAAGKRLLLVPTNWVWPRQLITAPSFYQVQALGRIQDALTTPAPTPGQRPMAPTKESLRQAHPDVRRTNIDQALDAVDDGINLTARHTEHVQNRFEEIKMSPDEINRLIS